MRTRTYDWVVLTILIIGALNWGLMGIFGFDLVAALFGGTWSVVSRIIYIVVGFAGLYALSLYARVGDSEMDFGKTHAS